MAYPQHRSDLIRARIGPAGILTLYRTINGLLWKREVRPNDFLTPMEAAVVLKVHRVTMYDWVGEGLIPSHESDYGVLLRWRDVKKFGKAQGRISRLVP